MSDRAIFAAVRSMALGAGLAFLAIGIGQKLREPDITKTIQNETLNSDSWVVANDRHVLNPEIAEEKDLPSLRELPTLVFPMLEADSEGDPNKERERLERLAEVIIPRGRAWQAKNGDEGSRTQANMFLEKVARYDKQLDSEKQDSNKTMDLIKRLDSILSDSETHVQDAQCGKTICRVNLIHETDVVALDFRPDHIMSVYKGMTVDTLMDRSDEDGRLKHFVYFRSPEAVSDGEKEAFQEMERQARILANGGIR